MPRFAVGDLLVDVDVPARFRCEYSLAGSLVALDQSTGAAFELSGLMATAKDPAARGTEGLVAVRERAGKEGRPLSRETPAVVVYGDGKRTWFAGFGSHLLIATVGKPELVPEMIEIMASVGAAHDPFPPGEETAVCDLRPSHTRWFEQKRTSLLDANRWSPELSDAPEKLDLFWEELITDPPDEEDLLNAMLNGVAVGFGDLLVKRGGFQWCVAKDKWGVMLAVVALRGSANVIVDPQSFVAKRWERKEPKFIADAVRDIAAQVARLKAK